VELEECPVPGTVAGTPRRDQGAVYVKKER
jgi:hypothetical protein